MAQYKAEKALFSSLLPHVSIHFFSVLVQETDARLRAQRVLSREFLTGLEDLAQALAFSKPNLRVAVKRNKLPAEFNIDAGSLLQVRKAMRCKRGRLKVACSGHHQFGFERCQVSERRQHHTCFGRFWFLFSLFFVSLFDGLKKKKKKRIC